MGCYGIGIGRTLAAVVECHHDERGIVWPAAAAPYDVHLVSLCRNEDDVREADEIHTLLTGHGLDVLYDDRPESRAGEKFADADLIGIPLRLVVSPRTLKERAEKSAERLSSC